MGDAGDMRGPRWVHLGRCGVQRCRRGRVGRNLLGSIREEVSRRSAAHGNEAVRSQAGFISIENGRGKRDRTIAHLLDMVSAMGALIKPSPSTPLNPGALDGRSSPFKDEGAMTAAKSTVVYPLPPG